MATLTGLDVLVQKDFAPLLGRRVGLVCNQASISRTLEYAFDVLAPHNLTTIFGPQHGLFGQTQDNMIEWEPTDKVGGPRLFSLYGDHRQPTVDMLSEVDLLVFDLQDVGARYYTFIWTMFLCMRACESEGIPFMVLDRPNPIGGSRVEGTLLEPGFESFVGLAPLPIRHGLTIGEVALHFQHAHFPLLDLTVERMWGYRRDAYFEDTGAPWAMPSPNMPSPQTAVVYPGGCLLEATNLSEGRGTTRPFEIFGAPWLDSRSFSAALNDRRLPGCAFRALDFMPTFNKHAGRVCGGSFLHVTERASFEPVLVYVAIMQEAIRQGPDSFEWKQPPYEYEYKKLPIDILAGNEWLREAIESVADLGTIQDRMASECQSFDGTREAALLY